MINFKASKGDAERGIWGQQLKFIWFTRKIAQFGVPILKRFPYITAGEMYGIPSIKIDKSSASSGRKDHPAE
jgi:hypothetical protein